MHPIQAESLPLRASLSRLTATHTAGRAFIFHKGIIISTGTLELPVLDKKQPYTEKEETDKNQGNGQDNDGKHGRSFFIKKRIYKTAGGIDNNFLGKICK